MPIAEDSATTALFEGQSSGRPDPFELFSVWLEAAKAEEINDPHAMALATVDESGMPDVRMVLLNGLSDRGFVFFTNTESAKGLELKANPRAALLFHWKSLRRQVRVRGPVAAVTPDQSDAYFASRPRGSQIGAHASAQSRELASRDVLHDLVGEFERKYADRDVPRPPHWAGYCIEPVQIEFWKNGDFRLHDRIVFRRERPDDPWTSQRLFP